jgi:hypothetical protein
VLDIRRIGEICRASTLRSRSQLHVLPVDSELLGKREEEESLFGNQEQEDIDGTGEVEN